MAYMIALDPDLDVSPSAFVAAWNSLPACRATAEARLDVPPSAQYDPFLAEMLPVLSGVALGLATNALYDLLLAALTNARGTITAAAPAPDPAPEPAATGQADASASNPTHTKTSVIIQEQPDGNRLIIITREET
jgi:hypothetical protein